jgi:hypothetical protein
MGRCVLHGVAILVAGVTSVVTAPFAAGQTTTDFDIAQAESVVELLESVARGETRYDLVQAIMQLEGTSLIVGQLNLARRVSPAQYEQLLTAFVERRSPSIPPLDDGMRARRGVEGLGDAWQLLTWALDRTDLLRRRIQEIAAMRIKEDARRMALEALPQGMELTPALFAVAGGRAGAAALGDSSIYFDIIVMSSVAERHPDQRRFDEQLIKRFVAHEFHHLALARLQRELESLPATVPGRWAFNVLASLVAEGSATYFIDWGGDLEAHRREAAFAEYLSDITSWYDTVEGILAEVFNGSVASADEFDDLASVMLGNSYHAVGAAMFATIDRSLGREAAVAAVADPRTFLRTFNTASTSYRFSERIASASTRLGFDE